VNQQVFQQNFFRRMGGGHAFRELFDHLPELDFFAKDRDGRFVACSTGLLRRLHLTTESEIIGVTDSDLHPPEVVKAILKDDARIMETGEPLIGRIEALYAEKHATDWFITTKLPIRDPAGKIIGVMGLVKSFRGQFANSPEKRGIEAAVLHIHQHYNTKIAIAEVARVAGQSPRQLLRHFRQTFGMSVQDFVIRTRVQAASDALLSSDQNMGEIAQAVGFYDQAAFSRLFKKHTGLTPMAYRQRRGLRNTSVLM
jgi:AraC-like DNA-binding protein